MTLLTPELRFARDLADQLGRLALDYLARGDAALRAREKPNRGGLITDADLELNHRAVSALRTAFPDDAVLAEESPDDPQRLARARCWMIDPIDGTRDYAAGRDTWAIHIGLCIDGSPTLGVVAEPAVGRTSWAIYTGDPAADTAHCQMDGVVSRVGVSTGDRFLRLITPRKHGDPRIRGFVESLPIEHTRQLGSVGVKLCQLARGEAEVYLHPSGGTSLWDTCAPEAILRAAGGEITDVTGAPLDYRQLEVRHRRGLLAASIESHARVTTAVSDQASAWLSSTSRAK